MSKPPNKAPAISSGTLQRPADSLAPTSRADPSRHGEIDSKKLIVGRDICLNGEITSCERLIVEGRVEVSLSDARFIDVAPTGFFKGNADVREADISGRFDGELTASERLTVRAGGRISGSVRYGSIVIEPGGEVTGDMRPLDATDETD
ncbi:MAG TPA: polymer-forming cytoskeletal protein [Rhodospirillales bacterium]|nr:polymer-forming cytoskeletal protein [Rhodospirillales bacterium]